ncbi:hypothetical protein [Rhizorhabdus sp. FW153]|uniref:hypothetical protein n=1 Tax=Rhizorhabdus sp. FW153 TaxID=3400216 RepID=UPI003CE81017
MRERSCLLSSSSPRGVGRLTAILLALAAAASPVAARAGTDLMPMLRQATERVSADDCAGALKLFDKAVRDPAFAALDPSVRFSTAQLGANCGEALADEAAMQRYALLGSPLDTRVGFLWGLRLWSDLKRDDAAGAVATMEGMAATNPAALDAMPLGSIDDVHHLVEEAGKPDLLDRLLVVLTDSTYQPDDPLGGKGYYLFQRAERLAQAGDQRTAGVLLQRIEEGDLLMQAAVHPNLAPLLPADIDFRAARERELERAREIAASHMHSLGAVVAIAQHLRRLGRPEEAVATLEAFAPEGALAGSYSDRDVQTRWFWDEMARNLRRAGRPEQAVAALARGLGASQDGGPNVDQGINLVFLHVRYGQPAAALAAAKTVGLDNKDLSAFGLMELRAGQGCARALSGDRAGLADDIAYARSHATEHPLALLHLLACAGDLDGAAAALVTGLDDPAERAGMLLLLSDYDAAHASMPLLPLERALPVLKQRPDVQAAIRRAGGTRRFPLQADEL